MRGLKSFFISVVLTMNSTGTGDPDISVRLALKI
jgi:hypothetical protein